MDPEPHEKEPRQSRNGEGRSRRITLIAIAFGVVAIALLALAALTDAGGKTTKRGNPQARQPPVSSVPPQGVTGPTPPSRNPALSMGRPDAPVKIIEFGDYQCPNCGRFSREIKPALVRKYVDTGVVAFFWRDFPAIGSQSERAAIAARAAGRQGKYWQFHDLLYARQPQHGTGNLTPGYLRDLAAQIGLDLSRYDADIADPALRKAVREDFAFGQRLSVPGTPAFLINGEPFFGAQPLNAFEKAIEKARSSSS